METGGGAINMTTIMALQESLVGAVRVDCKVSVPKTKSQHFTVDFEEHKMIFYDKQEPNITCFEHVENYQLLSQRIFMKVFHVAVFALVQ